MGENENFRWHHRCPSRLDYSSQAALRGQPLSLAAPDSRNQSAWPSTVRHSTAAPSCLSAAVSAAVAWCCQPPPTSEDTSLPASSAPGGQLSSSPPLPVSRPGTIGFRAVPVNSPPSSALPPPLSSSAAAAASAHPARVEQQQLRKHLAAAAAAAAARLPLAPPLYALQRQPVMEMSRKSI